MGAAVFRRHLRRCPISGMTGSSFQRGWSFLALPAVYSAATLQRCSSCGAAVFPALLVFLSSVAGFSTSASCIQRCWFVVYTNDRCRCLSSTVAALPHGRLVFPAWLDVSGAASCVRRRYSYGTAVFPALPVFIASVAGVSGAANCIQRDWFSEYADNGCHGRCRAPRYPSVSLAFPAVPVSLSSVAVFSGVAAMDGRRRYGRVSPSFVDTGGAADVPALRVCWFLFALLGLFACLFLFLCFIYLVI